MGGKTFLFQSIDTAQTAEDCSSANAPIVNGGRVGYEGVRVFEACHDIQILGKKDIALGSCAAGGRLWDVSDPWNPTTNKPGRYTLVNSPGGGDNFESSTPASSRGTGRRSR